MTSQDNLKTVSLNNGMSIPMVGLGTWQSKSGEVKAAIKAALEAGYRHIDCAFLYLNETEVGQALKEVFAEGKIKREDVFITSKLWSTCHKTALVRPSLQESLDMLGVKYVDLYLIHWPFSLKPGPNYFPKDDQGLLQHDDTHYMEAWRAMEKCVDDGLIKAIGVSNFNSQQIQEVLDSCRIKPTVLQVEIHPYFSQEKLVDFCHKRNIAVTAYSPLGSPARPWTEPKVSNLLEDESIAAVGKKHNKSNAQVILRWLMQRHIIVIPKSANPERIKQNLEVNDFQLSPEEMETINGFNKNLRLVTYGNGTTDIIPSAPYYPFNIEF